MQGLPEIQEGLSKGTWWMHYLGFFADFLTRLPFTFVGLLPLHPALALSPYLS